VNLSKHAGDNPFQLVLDTQLKLQKELAAKLPENGNIDPENMAAWATCGQMVDYMREQKDSLDDEFRELLTSFGGMSNGEKSATSVWKKWKKDNQSRRNTLFSELSEEDKLEVYMELIDAVHFFANKINALGLTADDVCELYLIKNAENFNRYNAGY
jgi:hypothetical protein